MRILFVFLLTIAAAIGGGATAQDAPSSSVLTVDLDRIVRESDYGQRVNGMFQADSLDLQAQAKQIENELIAEEQALVQKRATVSAEEFKVLSQTFDEKVVGVRQDQANKQSDLQQRQRDAERALLETIAPILYEIVRDRGASVLIDRRNIILDLSSVDITDDAIVKLNEQIGDGTKASEPAKTAQ